MIDGRDTFGSLATVGAFRVAPARDLRDRDDRPGNVRDGDLRHLREQGLVETVRIPGYREQAVVLTDRGRGLLEANRDRDRDTGQAFYAGLKRERELEHDAQIYRAYEREVARLEALAFAERVLPRASDLWVQASLDQRQRLQQLFSLTESCSMENGLFEPV